MTYHIISKGCANMPIQCKYLYHIICKCSTNLIRLCHLPWRAVWMCKYSVIKPLAGFWWGLGLWRYGRANSYQALSLSLLHTSAGHWPPKKKLSRMQASTCHRNYKTGLPSATSMCTMACLQLNVVPNFTSFTVIPIIREGYFHGKKPVKSSHPERYFTFNRYLTDRYFILSHDLSSQGKCSMPSFLMTRSFFCTKTAYPEFKLLCLLCRSTYLFISPTAAGIFLSELQETLSSVRVGMLHTANGKSPKWLLERLRLLNLLNLWQEKGRGQGIKFWINSITCY